MSLADNTCPFLPTLDAPLRWEIEKSFVIIRASLDRFASAVAYSIEEGITNDSTVRTSLHLTPPSHLPSECRAHSSWNAF